jgi:hypothetical protein
MRVVKGNQTVYDNFQIGTVEHGDPTTVGLAMTEQDFDMEELNMTHVWVLSTKQIPQLIEMLQSKMGNKIHIAGPEDMPA